MGNLKEIEKTKIKFYYRGTDLSEDLIILSAKFQTDAGNKNLIHEKMNKYSLEKKASNQVKLKLAEVPLKILRGKKHELIKNSNCIDATFGKASISKKHSNFFVNEALHLMI